MNLLSTTQLRTIFAGVAAVCAFLLSQTDVVVPPLVKLGLGAVVVFLAVVNPQGNDGA